MLVKGRSTSSDTVDFRNGRLPDVAVKIIDQPEDVSVMSQPLVHERMDVFQPIIGSSLLAENRNSFWTNTFNPEVQDVIVELPEVWSGCPWQCLDVLSHLDKPVDEFFLGEHRHRQVHAKQHVCSCVRTDPLKDARI